MPELPEVETVVNELKPHLIGRKVKDVDILWERSIKEPSPADFRKGLAGRKVTDLTRRGKFLVAHLDNGSFLVVHLRMSGSLIMGKAGEEPPPYTRVIITLDDGKRIFFRDPRKFGKMWLTPNLDSVMPELGTEPLSEEFTVETLAQILKKRSAPVKALLTDQSLIAGIGNMYADEALYAARIHPLRSGSSLTTPEIKRLHQAIREVLTTAIESKGSSIVNYYRPGGETGTAHFNFKVAHQRGEQCPVCGGPVERIVVRQRGTYFCPKCQKLKG